MLVAAALAALASMLFVPPDGEYLSYFDWQTIGCLFCVLAVANAFRRIGMFDKIARSAIEHNHHVRTLSMMVMIVTAAFSMAFTNDVALIIMLPLSATMLVKLGKANMVPIVFALQALAANLCGMITPFGNPQNLFLYSHYHLSLGEFLNAMALPFALSVIGVLAVTWVACREGREDRANKDLHANDQNAKTNIPIDSRRLRVYIVLFLITILAVFRVIPTIIAVMVILIVLAISDRKTLLEIDYALLGTFLCFFIFSGNVSRIPALGEMLGSLMSQWGLLVSALTSQVISNVPAAVILSHFTDAWQPLLIGVNIGGAGTFVGSLASLIAIRYFALSRRVFPAMRETSAPTMIRFLVMFGILNMGFFIALLLICQLIYG